MKPNIKLIVLIFLMYTFAGNNIAQAQNPKIRITEQRIELKGDSLHIKLALHVVRMNPNYYMDITPVLYKGRYEVSLPKTRIIGNRYTRILERKMLFDKKTLTPDDTSKIQTTNKGQTLYYNTAVAFQKWMYEGSLRIDKTITGCCKIKVLPPHLSEKHFAFQSAEPQKVEKLPVPAVEKTLATPIPVALSPTEVLAQRESFVRPISEYAMDKAKGMHHKRKDALRVYFKQGKYVINLSYADNINTLHVLQDALEVIIADPTMQIAKVMIIGYSSIEGTAARNSYIAKERALRLQTFVIRHGVTKDKIDIINMGEGWDKFRDLIEKSNLKEKAEVLYIIDNVSVMMGREKKLMDLKDGDVYRWMRIHIFPLQRSSGYIRIYYENKK